MNTANLQLEGLYLVLISLVEQLKAKGVLSAAEVDDLLATAEEAVERDAGQTRRSPANREAALFPARLFRQANRSQDTFAGFSVLARRVGADDGVLNERDD